MAHETSARVFRQASDDAREMAMRVRDFDVLETAGSSLTALELLCLKMSMSVKI